MYQACSLLQYAIRRISEAGHHKEIASITNANAFFTVFSGVLVDSFCRVSTVSFACDIDVEYQSDLLTLLCVQIPFTSEEEAREDIAALNKICCQSAYSYLYAEELLCTMDNKLYLLQRDASSQESIRYRVARSTLNRVRFELQETAVEKFGAKVGVFHPLRRRHLFDSNPRLSDAVLSIVKTKKCSEIAAEILAKEYKITKIPPPAAHLRDPIVSLPLARFDALGFLLICAISNLFSLGASLANRPAVQSVRLDLGDLRSKLHLLASICRIHEG